MWMDPHQEVNHEIGTYLLLLSQLLIFVYKLPKIKKDQTKKDQK